MTKRIVVCCDGTWNTPDQTADGRVTPTNVTKVAAAVAESDSTGMDQLVYYQPGVGTTPWERIRGGAFGFGLSRSVQQVYRFIVNNYEPGDELFLFGFSRGAYMARSTGGLIRNASILRRENVNQVQAAYDLYRSRTVRPRDVESALFRRSFSHPEPRIRFIGVWDTVGALGIPLSGIPAIDRLNRPWQFHDTRLSSRVDSAFHALAVDEARKPFKPALWQQSPTAKDQWLEQVWFRGVHCDVGGGYTETGLSDIALGWLAQRARENGLAFTQGAFTEDPIRWGTPSSRIPSGRCTTPGLACTGSCPRRHASSALSREGGSLSPRRRSRGQPVTQPARRRTCGPRSTMAST
jgi:uncharacterized protein (DUF2235 family)